VALERALTPPPVFGRGSKEADRKISVQNRMRRLARDDKLTETDGVRIDSEIEVTLLDDTPPETKQRDQELVGDDFRNHKGDALERLENLLRIQAEERRYLQSIERNGGTGRVVEFLCGRLELLESEIVELKAKRTSASLDRAV
jgi:hypothetical protein